MTTIRLLLPEDMQRVFEIESRCFPDPWPRAAFEMTKDYHNYAILEDELLIGYSINILALDEGMIANFAIDPDYQNRGLASLLLKHTIAKLADAGARHVYLDVRPSNRPARSLYEKHGFRYLGIRKGYYNNPSEDALAMKWEKEEL